MDICAFPYLPEFLWSPECQAWRLAEGGCTPPPSHCTSSKKEWTGWETWPSQEDFLNVFFQAYKHIHAERDRK